MSQGAVSPPDGTGAAYEAAVTAAFDAAFTQSSGAGAPSELLDYRIWADTTNMLLKQYDPATAAWIAQGYLAQPFMGMVQPMGNRVQTAVENLYIAASAATTVAVTADDALVFDTASPKRAWRTGAVSLTLNLAASGLNGLDTGSSGTGSMYHAWLVYNPTTGVVGGVLSLAYPGSGSVTMPAGFTAKGYLGPIGEALAASVVPDQTLAGDRVTMVAGGSATLPAATTTTTNLSSLNVPVIARELFLSLNFLSSSGTGAYNLRVGTPSGLGSFNNSVQVQGPVTSGSPVMHHVCAAIRGSTVQFNMSAGTALVTCQAVPTGYRI